MACKFAAGAGAANVPVTVDKTAAASLCCSINCSLHALALASCTSAQPACILGACSLTSSAAAVQIDGFPRALDQAESFEKEVKPCDLVRPKLWLAAPAIRLCTSTARVCKPRSVRAPCMASVWLLPGRW